MADNKHLLEYWFDNLLQDNVCSLCGQTGIIDTRGVRNANGIEVGRLNYCICPNGQKLKTANFTLTSKFKICADSLHIKYDTAGDIYCRHCGVKF